MRSLLVISVGAVALMATPAAARDGAWYVGGDFGAMIVEDADFEFTNPGPGEVTLDHDYGYDGALFVGYDLGAFRLEAEVAYKRAKLDEFEATTALHNDSGTLLPALTPIDAGGGHTSALSFMINGMLDFGDEDGVSGFVGGGLGIGKVSLSEHRAFNNAVIVDDSDTRLAWQIFAGIRTAVSQNVDVRLRYRFFNVNGLDFAQPGNGTLQGDVTTHSVMAGIEIDFGPGSGW